MAAPIVHAARLLLALAVEKTGLVLTPAGALKRVDVWHVFDQTEWPGYNKADILAVNKVTNEHDAYGVLFTRIALQAAGLLRKRSGVLKVTKAGKALLAPEAAPALLAELFEAVFWKMDLQDFDRNPIVFWPQHHMGVVLWSLLGAYRQAAERQLGEENPEVREAVLKDRIRGHRALVGGAADEE